MIKSYFEVYEQEKLKALDNLKQDPAWNNYSAEEQHELVMKFAMKATDSYLQQYAQILPTQIAPPRPDLSKPLSNAIIKDIISRIGGPLTTDSLPRKADLTNVF